jgi:hypothetical protein
VFSLAKLLTTSLATHRITRLITEDVITEPLRELAFQRWGDPSSQQARYTLSYAVTCPHCASIYAALFASVLATLARNNVIAAAILTALAASGAVSIYHERTSPPTKSGGWV